MIPADAWPEWADRHCWDEDGCGEFYGVMVCDSGWMPIYEYSDIPLPAGHDWRVPVMRYQPVQAIGRDRLLAIIDAQNACPFPVPAWARWVAQDMDGEWWAYESEPWVCSGDEGIVCDTRSTVEHLVEYYRNPNWCTTAVTENPVAWMVAGRLEQGLSFDKRAAETMAFANCGEVVPLYAAPQPAPAIDLEQFRQLRKALEWYAENSGYHREENGATTEEEAAELHSPAWQHSHDSERGWPQYIATSHVADEALARIDSQALQASPVAQRKLRELQAEGFIINGVAIFNPTSGRRGLVDYLGYVGWQAREQPTKGDGGVA